ncbi:MAG: preprotein translocase subunit YajC [Alphaproteobacteria bacterium]
MLISEALAQSTGGGGGGFGSIGSLLPIVLIFVVFWFLLIRPQQKRMKEHKAMVAALRRGDQVQTGGGIIGAVTKVVDDNIVQVEIAPGVKVKVARASITSVLSRTDPVAADTSDPDEDEPKKPKPAARRRTKPASRTKRS